MKFLKLKLLRRRGRLLYTRMLSVAYWVEGGLLMAVEMGHVSCSKLDVL